MGIIPPASTNAAWFERFNFCRKEGDAHGSESQPKTVASALKSKAQVEHLVGEHSAGSGTHCTL